ncbi:MAG: DUF1641 domain-containing protein [Solidesulfovibrio sp.]|uniref:DUF1641 domain-containing protein n=1 Tax=Solidesulfovibrio sp. TaxID=2910990 RepID=UPI002B21503E|nr:DUF1641 domain-containing protein [Solidesulfovibrio sp.]MEA4858253.1 DUF1641 domain-containing protein [Solidesulfovibrio sp.]
MNNEDLILEKLSAIEAELAEARASRLEMQELKHDLSPLMKSAFRNVLRELGQVDQGFELEDAFVLLRRFLRNMKNMASMLDQMENVIELVHTMEPLLKTGVHNTIRYLGTLEQRGVFRTYAAMLEMRAKVSARYTPEDFEQMSDAFVEMIGLLKKLATPEFMALLGKLTDLPAAMELGKAQPLGLMGLVSALRDPDLREGLGVGLQMAKSLKTLK